MKKRKVLYALYCVSIILILGIIIVLLTNRPNDSVSGDTAPVNSASEKVYATSLMLNCTREITIELDAELKLKDGFVTIEPSNCSEVLSYAIANKAGEKVDGISYKNNILKCDKIGFYYIKYSIASSETKTLTQTLVIHAVQDSDIVSATQLKTKLKVDNEYSIYDCVDVVTPNNAIVSIEFSSDLITLKNDKYFITNIVGKVDIEIVITVTCVEYWYKYSITIEEPDSRLYSIDILNQKEDIIYLQYVDGKVYKLQYIIMGISGNVVNQNIVCRTTDSTVAEILSTDAPFISILCLAPGNIEISISSIDYEDVDLTILIIFYE